MDLARTIKELRTAKSITQCEFAENIGMSPATYVRLEKGKRGIYVAEVSKIAGELNVHPHVLIGYLCQDIILLKDEEINALKRQIDTISEKIREKSESLDEREKSLSERERNIYIRERDILKEQTTRTHDDKESFRRILKFKSEYDSLKERLVHVETQLADIVRNNVGGGRYI